MMIRLSTVLAALAIVSAPAAVLAPGVTSAASPATAPVGPPKVIGTTETRSGLGAFDGAEAKVLECYTIVRDSGAVNSFCVGRGHIGYVPAQKGDQACRLADAGTPPFPCRLPAQTGWVVLVDPRGPLPR